jgi:superfamily II DNA or RNA helicase
MSTRKTKFPDVKKQYKDRSARNTRKSSPEIIDINKTQLRVILKESTDTISESKLQFPPKPTLLESSSSDNPCKKRDEIINKIKELEKQKREYQAQCNKLTTDFTTDTIFLELLQYLFKNNISNFDEFFSQFNVAGGGRLAKYHVFEGLWKIVFLLKLDNIFIDYERKFKLRMDNSKIISPFEYLKEKINSGSKSGICDLYFEIERTGDSETELSACEQSVNRPKADIFLLTSKYEKSESGSYDIGDIIAQATAYGIIGNSQIVVLTKNKQKACEKNFCYKNQIDKDFVFGEQELREIYFDKIIGWLHTNFNISNIDDENYWKDVLKDITGKYPLSLRFHQKYIVNYTDKILGKNTSGKFIWGAVARSGKTFMAGGLVSVRQPKIVILILGAVNETKNQFIQDLFKKYSDFKDYEIIDIQDKKSYPQLDLDKKYIIVISQEKLRSDVKKYTESKFIQFLDIVLQKSDKIVFFDEAHQGGSEESMQLDTLQFLYQPKYPEPILIMITATYGKPLRKYSNELGKKTQVSLVTWSYDMIQKMKTFSIDMVDYSSPIKNKLIHRRDENYMEKMKILYDVAQEYKSDISKEYTKYPELVYIVPQLGLGPTTFGESDQAVVVDQGKNILKLFELTSDKKQFVYKSAMNAYLTFIYDNVYDGYLNKKYNFKANGSGNTHSQLWFLPTNLRKNTSEIPGENDDKQFEVLSRLLAEEIMDNNKFINFNVCIIHSLKTTSDERITQSGQKIFFKCIKDHDVKECIKQRELESKRDNKSLIILTGKRLRLGISLTCVDVAIHMDPIQSYDTIYQSMFRVLTERKDKKYGFFVDMILDRAITFMYDYSKHTKESGLKESNRIIQEDVENTLILFNLNGITHQSNLIGHNYDDVMTTFNLNDEVEFDFKVSELYASATEKSLTNILSIISKDTNIRKELSKFIKDLEIQKEKLSSKSKTKIDVLTSNVEFQKESREPTIVIEESENLEDGISEIYDSKSIAKLIRNVLSIYVLFSDSSSNHSDLEELENFLREKTELNYDAIRSCEDDDSMYYCYSVLNTFNPSKNEKKDTNIFEKLKGASDEYIKDIINKQTKLIRFVYSISIDSQEEIINLYKDIKENMKTVKLKRKLKKEQESFFDISQFCPASFLENEKVLEIIRTYLTPKEMEKKLFGEVFTPVELVCEMLETIPSDIWEDASRKWLDPTCGIGNYPVVVYYKLMETLKSIPLNRRSRHIIENMLYMVELNPVNVALCKKIFKMIDPLSSLNIIKANFLEITDVNGVSEFDVIIGNPPFQDEVKSTDTNKPRSGGKNKLYERITIHVFSLLKQDGYLLFVTPDNIMTGITSSAYNTIMLYDTIIINFNNIRQRYFPNIGQSMCYFLVQKRKTLNSKTIIISQDGSKFSIVIKSRPINPVNEWTKDTEILVEKYIGEQENGYKRTRDGVSIPENSNGSVSVIMNSKDIKKTNNSNIEGVNVPKYILFRMQPSATGIFDKTGQFGVGPQIYYLSLIPYTISQRKMIENFFISQDYRKLQQITTTGQYLKDIFIKHIDIQKIIKNHAATKLQAITRGKQIRKKHNITKKGGYIRKSKRLYNKIHITRRLYK